MPSQSREKQPIAFLNGDYLPFSEAKLPLYDLGIVQGASVTERLRTVKHRPYMVREHLDRLQRSLEKVGWGSPISLEEIEKIIDRVVETNTALIPSQSDLSVVIFVTAGSFLVDANGCVTESIPTICVYTSPLPFAKYAEAFEKGGILIIPQIRQIPGNVIDPQIKMRSRLHWFLADQEVKQRRPDAQALLIDHNGFVTETSSANLFIVKQGRLQTPQSRSTLPGISQQFVIDLAKKRGLSVERAYVLPEEVLTADEAFLTSSTFCILPVSQLNGRLVGKHFPGPITTQLIEDWSEKLGIDLQEQALQRSPE